MRFVGLASDYDGTLAEHGVVDDPTLKGLEAFRHSGRNLLLVSGRELKDLDSVFPIRCFRLHRGRERRCPLYALGP